MTTKAHSLLHPKYRPDIDGLRAISVLLVVGYHMFPDSIVGGFIGVDIFFVISGFLISTILFENIENNAFSYSEFYHRRIQRIFPALILVLAATYIVGWHLLLPDEFKQLGLHTVAGAGFFSNLALWSEAGYFDPASDTKPLLHLWSLGVEEQFYIFWPILLGIVWKFKLDFLKTTIWIALISFLVDLLLTGNHETAAFYSPVSRFWELMVGGVLAYLVLHKSSLVHKHDDLKSFVGIGAIIIGTLMLTSDMHYPSWLALIPTLGAFLVIASRTSFINQHFLSHPVLVFIGLISYPIYLWHWPIMAFLRISNNGMPSIATRFLAIITTLILAYLTYALVEKPLRTGQYGKTKVISMAVLMVMIASIGYLTHKRDGLEFRIAKLMPEVTGTKPDIDREWRMNQCFLKDSESAYAKTCTERGDKPLVLLWGDSHAADLYPGINHYKEQYGYRVGQYTASGCKPFINDANASVIDVIKPNCLQLNHQVIDIIKEEKPDYVLLSGNWNSASDMDELRMTITLLHEAGIKHVSLVGPDPKWDLPLPRLVFSYYRAHHTKPPLYMDGNDSDIIRSMDQSMGNFAKSNGVRYFSSLDILCKKDACMTRTSENGLDMTFFDIDHLTPAGARLKAGYIINEVFSVN